VARRGRRRRLLGATVLAGSFAYLFAERVDWSDLTATSASFEPRYVVLLVAGQVVVQLLAALALWVLGRSVHPLGFRELLRAHWRGLTIGFWTPTGVGDASFAWLLTRIGLTLSSAIALLTVDKLVTLAVAGLLAAPLLWIAGPELRLPEAGPDLAAIGAVVAAVLVLAGLALRTRWAERIRFSLESYRLALQRVARTSSLRLAANFSLTVPRTLLTAAIFWWGIESFGVDLPIPFWRFVVVFAGARLIALVAPSPNGLGVLEVLLIELLGSDGGTASAVLAGSLAARVAGLLVVSTGFFLPLRREEEAGSGPAHRDAHAGRVEEATRMNSSPGTSPKKRSAASTG